MRRVGLARIEQEYKCDNLFIQFCLSKDDSVVTIVDLSRYYDKSTIGYIEYLPADELRKLIKEYRIDKEDIVDGELSPVLIPDGKVIQLRQGDYKFWYYDVEDDI